MTTAETTLDISPAELEELFNAPAFEKDKGYRVVFFDDNVTSQEFVVVVLVTVFELNTEKAVELMLQVHNGGSAEVFKGSEEDCRSRHDAVQIMNQAYKQQLMSLVEKID